MVKYRPQILLFSLMLVYLFIRFLRVEVEGMPIFIRYYLTDLLFLPVLCLSALVVIRYLKRDPYVRIPVLYVFIQALLISLYFEWYLPAHPIGQNQYTSDPFDVAMYFSGALIYCVVQPKM